MSEAAIVSAFAAGTPSAITAVPSVSSYINSTSIQVSWESITEDGGKPLLKYRVYVDGVASPTDPTPDSNSLIISGLALG